MNWDRSTIQDMFADLRRATRDVGELDETGGTAKRVLPLLAAAEAGLVELLDLHEEIPDRG